MADIVLKDVKKVYPGGNTAVECLNLVIRDGEFIVFVGPSGCGKSTTLRMIAGLEECTSGVISIDSREMNGVEPRDRDVAMVFQSYALYRHMTVYDNLAFTLKMKKIPKKDIDRRVRLVAETLRIDHLLNRKPSALSGGECQRVALGRALVRKRKVYLFDEPLSNLDAKLRSAMRAELIRLHEELEATFVYVTHDQTEAMTMGDRIAVMNAGVLMQCDTPQEIYSHPANMFTAGFIGTPQINFFDASLVGEYEKGAVTAAVRPEDVLMGGGGIPLGTGTVEMVELLGASMNVHLRLGETKIVLTADADLSVRRNAGYPLSVMPEKILYFDSSTQKAINYSAEGAAQDRHEAVIDTSEAAH